MKKLLFLLLLFPVQAFAGYYVCEKSTTSFNNFDAFYQSVDGTIDGLEGDPNCNNLTLAEVSTQLPFYNSTPRRYIKVESGLMVEMTQAEKDAQDAAEAQAREAEAKAYAKELQDQINGMARYLRAIVKLTVDQINNLRDEHGLSQITYSQAKSAIDNLIDAD